MLSTNLPCVPCSTEHKAAAIRRALTFEPAYQRMHMADLATLLAMLTSQNKDEREQAKKEVRAMVADGAHVLRTNAAEQALADFANRNEP